MQLVKTPENHKKLEKDMYDAANKIVGNVGTKIDSAFIFNRHTKDKPKIRADMPCGIALFCIRRKSPDHSEVMDVWTKWIKAYYDFKKLHRPEHLIDLNDNPELIIRWLQKPMLMMKTNSNMRAKMINVFA